MKISVIIPVYNAELYLKECLDSLLNQSLEDIEILIIDDGSDDGSLAIAQDYAANNSNIQVFQQERKRQGAARNVGLEHAIGEYVFFVDSDDWVPAGTFKYLYSKATRLGSDLLTGILQSTNKKRNWIDLEVQREYFNSLRANITISELPDLLTDGSVCNKFFKRSFIETHNLRFIERGAGEDTDFMAHAYILAQTITVVPKVVYKYCARPNSRTGRVKPAFFEDRVKTILDLEAFFDKHGAKELHKIPLLTEIRKLVGNRFVKMVEQLPYNEQLHVCNIITMLTDKLAKKDVIRDDSFFTSLGSIRIGLLWKHEFDALLAFTKDPMDKQFLIHLSDQSSGEIIMEPLVDYYTESLQDHNKLRKVLKRLQLLEKIIRNLKKKSKFLIRLFTGKSLRYFLGILSYIVCKQYFALSKKNQNEQLWLVDERVSTSAEDNGYFLFQYICKNHPEVNIHYVIKHDSPDRFRVENVGSVVTQYSFRHSYYLHLATALISTDSIRPLAFPGRLFPALLTKTHNVFLQHGLSANKKTTYTKRKHPYFNQVIVNSEFEKESFKKVYQFTDAEISVTGFSRFDCLTTRRQEPPSKKILIAPTWRSWLKERDGFANSAYLDSWSQVITSPELTELARKHGAELYFRPHFRMTKYLKSFPKVEHPVFILDDENLFLQDYIKSCGLLITDYSSIMYDFFYQEKPSICYMFDRRAWEKNPPGPPQIDFPNDLPADVVYSFDKLIASLTWYLENNIAIRQEHIPRMDKFFQYRDNNNCERIYKSILNR